MLDIIITIHPAAFLLFTALYLLLGIAICIITRLDKTGHFTLQGDIIITLFWVVYLIILGFMWIFDIEREE